MLKCKLWILDKKIVSRGVKHCLTVEWCNDGVQLQLVRQAGGGSLYCEQQIAIRLLVLFIIASVFPFTVIYILCLLA